MPIYRTQPGYRMQVGSGSSALLIVPAGTYVPAERTSEVLDTALARGVVVTEDPSAPPAVVPPQVAPPLSGWAYAYPGVSNLQALIDGMGASGGVLHLERDQTYTLTAALDVPDYLTIEGNGAHIVQANAAADAVGGVDVTGLTLRDLTIRRAVPRSGTGKGIRLTLSANPCTVGLSFDNVTVRDFGSDGIDLANPIVSSFRLVTARGNSGHGWNVHGVPGGAAGTSCRFDACYADQNYQSGFRLENMTYCGLGSCAADLNGIQYELVNCQGVELAASGCETPVNRSVGYPGHQVVVRGGFGVVLDALWTYESLTRSLWVTDNARGVVVRSMAENTPKAEATHCVVVDSGCRVTIEDCNNVRPYSLAGGTTSILNDGGGLTVPGYMYGAQTAYFEGEVGTSASPTYDGSLTPRGWVNAQLAAAKLAAATTRSGSYTLALADAGTTQEFTAGTSSTLTVPSNATAAFPVGAVVDVVQYGAGQVTVAGASGVTVRATGTAATRTRYSAVRLRKRGTDEWVLSGDTAA